MSTLNNGGPAFPIVGCFEGESTQERNYGMDVRTWLAGQAMAGLLSEYGRLYSKDIAAEIAVEARWCADALIRELSL